MTRLFDTINRRFRSARVAGFSLAFLVGMSAASYAFVEASNAKVPNKGGAQSSAASKTLTKAKTSKPVAKAEVTEIAQGMPLLFEPNKGQTDEHVKFTAHAQGYRAYLTADEAVIETGNSLLGMRLRN